MTFDEGDLVRVRHDEWGRWGRKLILGIVIDIDPSEDAPTYYLVSLGGKTPDWYHEDEVYSLQETK